jgi:hypothetical protein
MALLTSASTPPSGAVGRPHADPALEFLATHFALRESDIGEVEHYQPVTRSLDASEGREVATVGAIRLRVPVEFYVNQLRNVADFKRNDSVLQIGTFSSPARLEDVQSLTLESDDVAALERCRPKACGIQLSAEAMRRLGQATAATASARTAMINRAMRDVLVDMVNGYRQAGDVALMTYVDGDDPVSVAAEFRAMVDAQPAILKRFPTLDRHMRRYPEASPDTDDIIYWSKERLGPEIVVSVTHLAVARLAGSQPARFAAASRQIYGSHYFDASLGITMVLEDAARPAGSYLVYVNRSRLDALGGFFGPMKRLIVRSRTRSAMSKTLLEARDLVERRFAAARTR